MTTNPSDILCLKEPKFGESDGSQIYSINGSPSKINRPPKTQEFSKISENANPENEQFETLEPTVKKNPQEASEGPNVSFSKMKRNTVTGVGLEADDMHDEKKHYGLEMKADKEGGSRRHYDQATGLENDKKHEKRHYAQQYQ
ncbi:uncharacterized protein LOC123013452 [Tribolium madens]|uniref:uncharacterized protein LOC123013452 n=1 Tax=Tribolium madens TaxID=41895 RepID=UPI001CF73128|nr:uncharacterized protein LOC123013452 [Tribolium madens]